MIHSILTIYNVHQFHAFLAKKFLRRLRRRKNFEKKTNFYPKVSHFSNLSAPSAPKNGSLIDFGHPFSVGQPPKSIPGLSMHCVNFHYLTFCNFASFQVPLVANFLPSMAKTSDVVLPVLDQILAIIKVEDLKATTSNPTTSKATEKEGLFQKLQD